MYRINFTPRLVPSLAAMLALALTFYLGHWQQGRADEKRTLQRQFDVRVSAAPIVLTGQPLDLQAVVFQRAHVSGTWLDSGQIFIDNKFDQDRVGYHVITPLRIAGSERYVLVNRGWIARGPGYPAPPRAGVPVGSVEVAGTISSPSQKFLELSANTVSDRVWQNLTLDRYREVTKLDIMPFVLLASVTQEGLRAVKVQPDAGVAKHVEYMLTWYSLAATVVALWVALNLKLRPRAPATANKIGNAS